LQQLPASAELNIDDFITQVRKAFQAKIVMFSKLRQVYQLAATQLVSRMGSSHSIGHFRYTWPSYKASKNN